MSASRTTIIADPLGLHARPAAEFVTRARTYESDLSIASGDKTGNCKSLISILKLGIAVGTEVTITAAGPDEAAAIEELGSFLEIVHGDDAP